MDAARKHGLPSRIRTDRGVENVIIGDIMESVRGQGRGSWLKGPSVHNQRIERLWRDLRCFCTNFYIDLFHKMEEIGILIAASVIHRFCLHYVFLPRLNTALHEFQLAYNHHGIRTMNYRSPYRIYISGLMGQYNSNHLHVRELLGGTVHNINLAEFGVEGNVAGDNNDDSVVNVIRPSLGLNLQDYTRLTDGLRELVPDLNANCNDHGIALYMLVLVFVQRFVESLQ